jgi:membrane protease YdiL (CAAX protease family)
LFRAPIFWWGLLFEAGLGGLAWLLGWWWDRPPLAGFRWDARDAVLGLLICVPMYLGFLACVRWPVGPLERIKQFSEEVIRPLFASCSVLELALISLGAGIGEEMLFRGLFQALFSDWWGPVLGLLAASTLFGLMHFITPTYAVLAGLLGIYLGGIWVADGNLLSVIIAHALYDLLALVHLVKGGRDVTNQAPLPYGPGSEEPGP